MMLSAKPVEDFKGTQKVLGDFGRQILRALQIFPECIEKVTSPEIDHPVIVVGIYRDLVDRMDQRGLGVGFARLWVQ